MLSSLVMNTILVSGTTPDGDKLFGGDTAVGGRYTPVVPHSSVVVGGDAAVGGRYIQVDGSRHNTQL